MLHEKERRRFRFGADNVDAQYDIPDLKLLACEKFCADSVKLFNPSRFAPVPQPHPTLRASINVDTEQDLLANAKEAWFKAVDHIYENSNPTEKGLRASVVKVWQSVAPGVKTKIGKKPWEELVAKFPKLGVEMIMELNYRGESAIQLDRTPYGQCQGSWPDRGCRP